MGILALLSTFILSSSFPSLARHPKGQGITSRSASITDKALSNSIVLLVDTPEDFFPLVTSHSDSPGGMSESLPSPVGEPLSVYAKLVIDESVFDTPQPAFVGNCHGGVASIIDFFPLNFAGLRVDSSIKVQGVNICSTAVKCVFLELLKLLLRLFLGPFLTLLDLEDLSRQFFVLPGLFSWRVLRDVLKFGYGFEAGKEGVDGAPDVHELLWVNGFFSLKVIDELNNGLGCC